MNFKKILYLIKNPSRVVAALGSRGYMKWLPDALYLKCAYKSAMGKPLNLKNPKTFNEKIQWLKLHDRKPIYTTMVDKYEVKKFVTERIGEEYVIPTLGVWEKFDDIDFNKLPNQFVLKCTHDSGGLVICKDKSSLDIEKAKEKINKSLKRNYFWHGREWPYKDVRPRIIAEEYMEDRETAELRDYKFFTFNGQVKALFIATERGSVTEETKFDFFDDDFNHLNVRNGHPNAKVLPKKPKTLEKMKELCEQLSAEIPHLRVDFYEVNGKPYLGELTFSHWSGFMPFEPAKWDDIFGQWIQLPQNID